MTSSRTASVFRGGSDNHVLQMRKDEGSLASCGSPTPYDIDSPRRKYKSFNEMHNHPLAASGHHLSDSGTIPKRPVWGEQDRDSSWDNSSSSLLTDLKVLTDTFAKNKRFQYAHIVPVLSVLAGLAVLVSVWGLVDRVLHSMQSHEEVPPIDVSAVTLSGAQLHAILEETRKEAVRGYGVHPYPVYLVPVLQVVLAGVFLLLLVVMQRAEGEVREGVAQDRALLRQLLPPVIIQAIHLGDHISIWHPDATFCFTDIVGFTRWSSAATPARVVSVLDRLFAIFDELALQHGVFKIKTMGDAYMGVAGINGNDDIEHAMSVLKWCIDVLAALGSDRTTKFCHGHVNIRVGVATGPAVSGVIGKIKPVYDFWGDTVNMASRMETCGMVNRINCAESTRERVQDEFEFTTQNVFVKGHGKMDTFILKRVVDVAPTVVPQVVSSEPVRWSEGSTSHMLTQLAMIQSVENYQTDLRHVLHAVTSLSDEFELPKFMTVVVDTVCQLLTCERATLFMADSVNDTLWSYHPVYRGQKIRMSSTSGIAGHSAVSQEITNIVDAYNDPRFNRSVDQSTGFKTRTLLSFPVLSGKGEAQHAVAVIQAVNKKNGTFTVQDEFLISLVGRVIGSKLEHSLMYEKLCANEKRQQVLFDVSRELNLHATQNVATILESVTAGAKLIVDCDRVSLFLMCPHNKFLRSLSTSSLGVKETITVSVGIGIVGTIADTGTKLNVKETRECPFFDSSTDERTGYVTRDALGVPIIDPGTKSVLGVLLVVNKQGASEVDASGAEKQGGSGGFLEEDEEFLEAFASFIALCVRNAVLFEQHERHQDEMRLMLRCSVLTSGMRNASEMVDLFQKEIPVILRCEACRILVHSGATLHVRDKGVYRDLPYCQGGACGVVGEVLSGNLPHYITQGEGEGEGEVFEDTEHFLREYDNSWGLSKVTASIIIPLLFDADVIGVVQVVNKNACTPSEEIMYGASAFSLEDVGLLKEVGAVVGVHLAQQHSRDQNGSPEKRAKPLLPSNTSTNSILTVSKLDFLLTPRHSSVFSFPRQAF